ncbi:MAG: hypothetical protein JW763_04450 [candidate division Zixibacteria bacterium]|nr:hypothetical protein [candidate division Zixibacteria bacterium]
MNPKTRQISIGIVFVAALIYGISEFTATDSKTAKPVESQPQAASTIMHPQTAEKNTIDLGKYEQLPWGRDPFYLAQGEQPTTPASSPNSTSWTLNGILFNALAPSAVINKRVVRTGDQINGARVVKIDKRQVTLEKDGEQIILHMNKETS